MVGQRNGMNAQFFERLQHPMDLSPAPAVLFPALFQGRLQISAVAGPAQQRIHPLPEFLPLHRLNTLPGRLVPHVAPAAGLESLPIPPQNRIPCFPRCFTVFHPLSRSFSGIHRRRAFRRSCTSNRKILPLFSFVPSSPSIASWAVLS